MRIHVQLLSILRDCLPPNAERGKATATLPQGATLADLVTHLGIDEYLGYDASELTSRAAWQVMVSGQFELDMGRVLQDGDEVLMPLGFQRWVVPSSGWTRWLERSSSRPQRQAVHRPAAPDQASTRSPNRSVK